MHKHLLAGHVQVGLVLIILGKFCLNPSSGWREAQKYIVTSISLLVCQSIHSDGQLDGWMDGWKQKGRKKERKTGMNE